MLKMAKKLLVHSFEYHEFIGVNRNHVASYKNPIIINNCRIDFATIYSRDKSQKQVVANMLILCYQGVTTPFIDFKEQSKIIYQDKEYILQKVIPITQPYSNELFSYELEVL